MTGCTEEPTLAEVLADPLILAVMAADRVDAEDLKSALTAAAGWIASRSPGPPREPARAVARTGDKLL